MAPHRPEDDQQKQAQTDSWAAVNYLMRQGWSWSGSERNSAFLNVGGQSFADISWLSGFGYKDDGRAVVSIDWDGDGDLDLFANNRSSPRLRYLRNNYDGPNSAVQLHLVATEANRDAVGARVTVRQPERSLIRTLRNGVNYEAQNSKTLHFGLGDDARILDVTVRWPDGSQSVYADIKADQRYVLTQGESQPRILPEPGPQKGLMANRESYGAGSQTASIPLGTPIPLPGRIGLTTFDGERRDLESFKGRPVLINIWASWCNPCVVELTDWIAHQDEIKRTGVQILAATVDTPEDLDNAVKMASDMGFFFPAGSADTELLDMVETIKKVVLDNYQDMPLPSSFLIDQQGRLRSMYRGPVEPATIASDIDRMNAARTPAAVLSSAAVAPGRWVQSDFWADTQHVTRLMRLTDFAYTNGNLDLATDFGLALMQEMTASNRLPNAIENSLKRIGPVAYAQIARNPTRAVELFREMIRYRPDNPDLKAGLVGALVEVGDRESATEAGEIFSEILPRLPEPVDATRAALYGDTLISTGRGDQAVKYLRQAVEMDPDNAEYQIKLGSALISSDEVNEGIDLIEGSIDEVPPNGLTECILGSALDRVGRTDEALTHFKRALELLVDPRSMHQHLAAGTAAFRLGRWQLAAQHLGPVVEANPDNAGDRLRYGVALSSLGRSAEAIKHLEYAVPKVDPEAENFFYLGITRAQRARFDDANQALRRALELDPKHQGANRSLAMVLEGQRDYPGAIKAYADYLNTWPDDNAIRFRQAQLFELTGATGQAVEAYRAIINQSPDDDSARFRLAWILATTTDDAIRDGATASGIAASLVKKFGDAQPLPYDLLAAAQATMGDFDAAVGSIDKALQIARDLGMDRMAPQLEARKALYQQQKPYREGR